MSDNPLRRILRNAGLLVMGKGANALFSLAYLALAARTLGLEQLGLLVLIHAYAQAVGEMLRFQSSEAVLRFGAIALHRDRLHHFRSLIRMTALLDGVGGIVATGAALLLCGFISPYIGLTADLVPSATAYCLSILFMATATATGLLRLYDRFYLLAIQSAVASLIRLVGSGILFVIGGDVADFLLVWALGTLVANAFLSVAAWRETQKRGLLRSSHPAPDRLETSHHTGLWSFIGATQLNASLTMLYTHLGTLLAGGLLGPAEAALYRIARDLAEAAAKPTKLLIPAIYPELAQLATVGAWKRIRGLIRQALSLAAIAASGCFLLLWLAGEILLRLLVGEAGLPAFPLLLMLAAAALIALGIFPLEPLLICVGRERTILWIRVAALTIYVSMSLLLTPTQGVIGLGIAAMLAAAVSLVGQSLLAKAWSSERPRINVAKTTKLAACWPYGTTGRQPE
jgi:O-antigen/teichoic acid export membrane protein